MGRFVHIAWLVILTPLWLVGQDISLANEYLQKEDFQKAKIHYELALNKNANPSEVYPGYVQSLTRLNENKLAEKFFKKHLVVTKTVVLLSPCSLSDVSKACTSGVMRSSSSFVWDVL